MFRFVLIVLVGLNFTFCAREKKEIHLDPLWIEMDKKFCQDCYSKKVSVDGVNIKKFKKQEVDIIHADFDFDESAKKYIFVSGTVNGSEITKDNKYMKGLMDPVPSSSEYTEAIRTSEFKRIAGRNALKFKVKKNVLDPKSNSIQSYAEGVAWVDPEAKVLLEIDLKHSLPTFSFYRFFIDRSESYSEFSYTERGKLILRKSKLSVFIKFLFLDFENETSWTTRFL
ncbi:hypothetical protein [Leptospira licerasiae]|uniref:hypothetical protein n=1 Tax=Leptospira licerasiae TaxID=447106 RepID=UPI003017EC20